MVDYGARENQVRVSTGADKSRSELTVNAAVSGVRAGAPSVPYVAEQSYLLVKALDSIRGTICSSTRDTCLIRETYRGLLTCFNQVVKISNLD